jgi:hypothetical protein
MTIIILLSIIVHIMMVFMICTPRQIITGVQIKMNEMGGARGTHGGHESCIQGVGGETRGKQTTWKRGKGKDNINMDLQEI